MICRIRLCGISTSSAVTAGRSGRTGAAARTGVCPVAGTGAAAGAAVNDQAQWREFFNQSDHVRYASAATMSRAELSEWIAAVSGLLRRAERLRL